MSDDTVTKEDSDTSGEGSELLAHWHRLRELVEASEVDLVKNASGNRAAGVRLRKALRLVGKLTADIKRSSLTADKASKEK